MSNCTEDIYTLCPFYDHCEKLTISCEGLAENTVSITRFHTGEERKAFMKKNCYNRENHCSLAKSLYEKYEMADRVTMLLRTLTKEEYDLLYNELSPDAKSVLDSLSPEQSVKAGKILQSFAEKDIK